jgi:hypothetical protein
MFYGQASERSLFFFVSDTLSSAVGGCPFAGSLFFASPVVHQKMAMQKKGVQLWCTFFRPILLYTKKCRPEKKVYNVEV